MKNKVIIVIAILTLSSGVTLIKSAWADQEQKNTDQAWINNNIEWAGNAVSAIAKHAGEYGKLLSAAAQKDANRVQQAATVAVNHAGEYGKLLSAAAQKDLATLIGAFGSANQFTQPTAAPSPQEQPTQNIPPDNIRPAFESQHTSDITVDIPLIKNDTPVTIILSDSSIKNMTIAQFEKQVMLPKRNNIKSLLSNYIESYNIDIESHNIDLNLMSLYMSNDVLNK